MPSWTLTEFDGARQCPDHGDSICTKEEVLAQEPGDYVQVRFEVTRGGHKQNEAIWLYIQLQGEYEWCGIVSNDPVIIPNLMAGVRVNFKPTHVRRILVNGVPHPFPKAEDNVLYLPD